MHTCRDAVLKWMVVGFNLKVNLNKDGRDRVSIVWRVNGVNKDLEVEIRVECSGNTN